MALSRGDTRQLRIGKRGSKGMPFGAWAHAARVAIDAVHVAVGQARAGCSPTHIEAMTQTTKHDGGTLPIYLKLDRSP